MLKNFDLPDVYMLAAFYFWHSGSLYVATVCAVLAMVDAYALKKYNL